MTNIGIDLMALNNRLSLTADWYVKNTKDILLNVPIPISTGGANDPIRNAGKIQNTGVEFNLGWNDRISNDLSYGLSFIGTYNKNEVKEMGSESQAITGGTIHGGTYTTKTIAGYPIGGFWLIKTDGYFNSVDEVNSTARTAFSFSRVPNLATCASWTRTVTVLSTTTTACIAAARSRSSPTLSMRT